MKLADINLTDEVSRHEIDGHENGRQIQANSQDVKQLDMKLTEIKLTDMKMQDMFQVAEYIGLYLVDFGLSLFTVANFRLMFS